MKTYVIAAVKKDKELEIFSTPILTCSKKSALLVKRNWNKNLQEINSNYKAIIWVYNLKTKGPNFVDLACAERYDEGL